MKRSTREAVAAVFYALDNLNLVPPRLCSCRRPIPVPLPAEVLALVDKARAALAGEPENRIDYMDVD